MIGFAPEVERRLVAVLGRGIVDPASAVLALIVIVMLRRCRTRRFGPAVEYPLAFAATVLLGAAALTIALAGVGLFPQENIVVIHNIAAVYYVDRFGLPKVAQGTGMDLDEAQALARAASCDDAREGIMAFVQKRKTEFKGK